MIETAHNTMESWICQAENEEGTNALGRIVAEHLPPGSVVALIGTLGAGKTRLVQAIAAAAGVDRRLVVSPTFVLVQQYAGPRTIYHIDAYRVGSDDEFMELGVEEYFESDGWTFVEWADRVTNCMPPERLEIRLEVTGNDARRFELRPFSARYAQAVQKMAKAAAETEASCLRST